MEERAVELHGIDWGRTFPWVRLFRVFRTAIDLRMLSLGCVGLVALAAGDALFVRLPFAPAAARTESAYRWDDAVVAVRPLDVPESVLRNPAAVLWSIASRSDLVLRPLRTVAAPVLVILRADAAWSDKALAWTRLLWALCVWSVIAGAMTRIAAVEQTGETKVSIKAAVMFSLQNFWSYLVATLLPVGFIGAFWLLCTIGGLIGRIPYLGQPFLGLVWGLELVFGCVMALALSAGAAGWPLMYATISTQGSDGFDGFSRAYSYVYGRPWHYLWYAAVAAAYGAVVISFVSIIASLTAYLAAAGVASGLGPDATGGLLLGAPETLGGSRLLTTAPSSNLGFGTFFAATWLEFLALLVYAFITSYFWTAATVIYLLLRKVDDATDFHEVYLPQQQEPDDLLPLVGVAASQQPIIERPPCVEFAAPAPAPPAAAQGEQPA